MFCSAVSLSLNGRSVTSATQAKCDVMEAVRTSETSVDNYFTRQYIPEYNSEHHTCRRENLKSHIFKYFVYL
jgi:hypothetical protein